MCGIFGYVGHRDSAVDTVIKGLKLLDYRGYDSWGVGVKTPMGLIIKKAVGKVSDVDDIKLPPGKSALAHTRWATTGIVNVLNAHPHLSSDQSFLLVHNGIVENFQVIKTDLLAKHYLFNSDTDTEVIVRLIENFLQTQPNMFQAVSLAFKQLQGRNTIAILMNNGDIIAARNGSPLVIGMNSTNHEFYLSSDVLSFSSYVDKYSVINNQQMIVINHQSKPKIFDLLQNKEAAFLWQPMSIKSLDIDIHNYDHFMIKEIFETPQAINQITNQDQVRLKKLADTTRKAHQVYVVGSGTAGYAASQIAFYLRYHARINAISLIGAEASSYYPLFQSNDLIIAPSQSGETADVLEVLEIAKSKGVKIASLVNMPGSLMTRMSDYPFMCQAGPEICVMSTKVFSSQISWGYLLAKTIANQYSDAKIKLKSAAVLINTYLNTPSNLKSIQVLAKRLMKQPHLYLLGKHQNQAIMNEGMVKLIEATYHHAHAIPAGDLKHYAITLIEANVPVIVSISNDIAKSDMISAINQVKLRGAQVYALAHDIVDSEINTIIVPDGDEVDALCILIPLQLLAYYMSVSIGNNVDKPRNIAKSVTVK